MTPLGLTAVGSVSGTATFSGATDSSGIAVFLEGISASAWGNPTNLGVSSAVYGAGQNDLTPLPICLSSSDCAHQLTGIAKISNSGNSGNGSLDSAIAVATSGQIYGWGYNAGQLLGQSTPTRPALIGSTTNYVDAVITGNFWSVGRDNSGNSAVLGGAFP